MLNQRQTGIYLTILGVGVGNLKDSKLQTLAKKGNGNYAYLDDINEAQKVFVKELTQTLYAVADNVSMSVQFNPRLVKKYRLIGFDNKKEAIISNDKFLEGGEIGSGSSVMAIFEIIPNEKKDTEMNKLDELATLTLQFKSGLDSSIKKELFSALNNAYLLDSVENFYQFATAVTMFGLILKQSKYFKNVNWSMIESLANHSADKSNYLQSDFLKIIEKAKKVYKEPINRRNKKRFILF
jgi:Ca-activated chloride channel family protein